MQVQNLSPSTGQERKDVGSRHLQRLIAMIDGYVFLHERISWNMLLGAVAVLGSLGFVLRAEAKTDRFRLAEDATSHKKGR